MPGGPERVIKPYRINFQTGLISEIKFEGLFSHASFVDTGNIVYFGKKNGVSGYILHCLESSQTTMLYETRFDGHPTVLDDVLLTDTYPDHRSQQLLYSVNLESGRAIEMFQGIVHPRYRGHLRCDLHPKILPDGSGVVFDVAKYKHREIRIQKILH